MHIQVIKTVNTHYYSKYRRDNREGHKVRRNEGEGSACKEEPVVMMSVGIVAEVRRVVGEITDSSPRRYKTDTDKRLVAVSDIGHELSRGESVEAPGEEQTVIYEGLYYLVTEGRDIADSVTGIYDIHKRRNDREECHGLSEFVEL